MPSNFEAGGGNDLGIVRYGREAVHQFEREADEQILPGQAVAPTVTNGDPTYNLHGGDTTAQSHHVAVEARGRGMDAETAYPAGDVVRAYDGDFGGHLRVAAGEVVTEDDPLIPDPSGTGNYVVYDSGVAEHAAENVVGHAEEDADLSGASEATLVEVNIEG